MLFGLNNFFRMTSNKNTLWIVSELFYPETTSTGYIMTEIAKELSMAYHVKVIAGPITYSRTSDGDQGLIGADGEIEIFRISGNGYDKNSILNRLFGQLNISFRILRLMLKNISLGSRVLIVTNPILLLYILSFFSRVKQWRVSLLVHDIFPDNLVPAGIMKQNSLFFSLLNEVFKRAYRKVDEFIVLGRDMRSYLQDKYPKVKVNIIENWAELDLISNPFLRKDNCLNNDKLSFLFAGNIGRLQGLDVLLESIKSIPSNDIRFNFIGDGALKEKMESLVVQNKLDNVYFYGSRPREEQNEFLNQCHIGVVSLASGMFGMGVPSKFYNLLAAGKAIFYIGDVDTELKYILDEYKNGWYAKAGDSDNIKNVLNKIISTKRQDIIEMGRISRKLAEEVYAKEIILSKYTDLYKA